MILYDKRLKSVYNVIGGYMRLKHIKGSEEVVENKTTTRKAMSTQTAYMRTSVLKSTASTYGYLTRNLTGEYAAKTGTTNFDGKTISSLSPGTILYILLTV